MEETNMERSLRTRISTLETKTQSNYTQIQNLVRRVDSLEKEVGMIQPKEYSLDNTMAAASSPAQSLMSRASNEERLTTQDARTVDELLSRVIKLETAVGIVVPPEKVSSAQTEN